MFLSLCPVKIFAPYYGNYTAKAPPAPRTDEARPGQMKSDRASGDLTLAQGAVCGPLCALGGPSVLPAPGSCGQQAYSRRRPAQVQRRSEHMHKTGAESGHMTGTNAGAIRVVHCRPQACQSFAVVRW